jgi:transcription initiation factor TFIIIB Brf1 subunit/transcription initiation factor TFIIB
VATPRKKFIMPVDDESPHRPEITVDNETRPLEICPSCGWDDFSHEDRQITCRNCGCVQGPVIDYRDRRAYTNEQSNSRLSMHATSFLVHDKDLGSVIRANHRESHDESIRRLIIAERKLATRSYDRELKDAIRILSVISDTSKLELSRNEVEGIIMTYRKRFLGTKISIGRPRYAVILAFAFLELQKSKRREYMSMNEFLRNVNIDEIKKNTVTSGRNNTRFESEIVEDFKSAVAYFVREHGYKIKQPPLDVLVRRVMIACNIDQPVINDAIRLARIISRYYKTSGVKHTGIAGAIAIVSCTARGMSLKKRDVVKNTPGELSPVTIRTRIHEIKYILTRIRGNLCNVLDKKNLDQKTREKSRDIVLFVDGFL